MTPELAGQGVIDLLDRVLRTADPYVGRCERFVLRDAAGREEEAYLDFVYQPIVNALGETVGIFVQGHEVTGQYLARQALLAADHHKDQFIATLAHELRNPLAPIRAAARLLESGNLRREQVSHTTGVITRQVEQMAHLLDDLLDVARITKNQVRLQKAAVNADELVALALESTAPADRIAQAQAARGATTTARSNSMPIRCGSCRWSPTCCRMRPSTPTRAAW